MKNFDRLFTFGCSFTEYKWPTWANILALHYNIPLYNYGKCGAGNQYIFNMLMQADGFYNFNSRDLVIVQWTNLTRVDSYKKGEWVTPGNIFFKYDPNNNDENYFILRDFATIKASIEFLKNKNISYEMFKMNNFEYPNQFLLKKADEKNYTNIESLYSTYLKIIKPSFYEILWDNNINKKFLNEKKLKIKNNFSDGHPLVTEHLKYLQTVLNIEFSPNIIQIIYETDNKLIELLKLYWQKENNFVDYKLRKIFFNQSVDIKKI